MSIKCLGRCKGPRQGTAQTGLRQLTFTPIYEGLRDSVDVGLHALTQGSHDTPPSSRDGTIPPTVTRKKGAKSSAGRYPRVGSGQIRRAAVPVGSESARIPPEISPLPWHGASAKVRHTRELFCSPIGYAVLVWGHTEELIGEADKLCSVSGPPRVPNKANLKHQVARGVIQPTGDLPGQGSGVATPAAVRGASAPRKATVNCSRSRSRL